MTCNCTGRCRIPPYTCSGGSYADMVPIGIPKPPMTRFRISRTREGWLYEDRVVSTRMIFGTRDEARSFKSFVAREGLPSGHYDAARSGLDVVSPRTAEAFRAGFAAQHPLAHTSALVEANHRPSTPADPIEPWPAEPDEDDDEPTQWGWVAFWVVVIVAALASYERGWWG